jgi:CRISPR-associated protein Csd1
VESLSKPEIENPLLAALFTGEPVELKASDRPEQVKKSLVSPWAGREFESICDNAFYAISLSANGGRAVVRDQLTSTVRDVRDKLRAYFRAQRMVDNTGQSGNPLGIYTLAAGLYRDANKEMAPAVPVSLLSFALRGNPLPFAFLQRLVRRNCIERRVTRPRAVLTKMVLLSKGKEMRDMEKLNTDRLEIAYHLGRLLAVLEGVQKAAQPAINATIVDRFYGSASTTPAWVFGRLISGAQNNLGKLRKNRPAIHTASEKRLQEVLSHIQEFPPVLKVEDQALFGLGYFHEKAHHWEQIIALSADKKKSVKQPENESPAS